ncbi:hypothetical protein FIV42_21245 [Persicimonas caeni]|uniref:MEDS domain-containing protein n=1 Tax=Persicimonas caeni TaxID=2292766 RepID=A0A4Y6PYV3_PERCE|nr:MEDS domain-containing protein [Persicimonas caeni]QDG53177.1 hypothetical protein FIV42_21245 [Persicimonas caeni]QED34399.1 hypothetical protein FRD00_21240 [Persicimonas caeni]
MSYERRPINLGFSDEHPLSGSHICYIYSSDEERLETLAKFFKAGCEDNEKLLYVSDTLAPAQLRERMQQMGVDLADKCDALVETTESAYAPEGRFSAEAMLEEVRTFYADAIDEGYSGARCTGEMNWAAGEIECAETAMEYEAQVNELFKHYPCTGICQYDARQFPGDVLMDVLQVHPYMIVRGQLVLNPYYRDPQEFIDEYRRRVDADEACRPEDSC